MLPRGAGPSSESASRARMCKCARCAVTQADDARTHTHTHTHTHTPRSGAHARTHSRARTHAHTRTHARTNTHHKHTLSFSEQTLRSSSITKMGRRRPAVTHERPSMWSPRRAQPPPPPPLLCPIIHKPLTPFPCTRSHTVPSHTVPALSQPAGRKCQRLVKKSSTGKILVYCPFRARTLPTTRNAWGG